MTNYNTYIVNADLPYSAALTVLSEVSIELVLRLILKLTLTLFIAAHSTSCQSDVHEYHHQDELSELH